MVPVWLTCCHAVPTRLYQFEFVALQAMLRRPGLSMLFYSNAFLRVAGSLGQSLRMGPKDQDERGDVLDWVSGADNASFAADDRGVAPSRDQRGDSGGQT